MNETIAIFGVFDGLHDGHTFFIREASTLGNSLTIIVTPDEIVQKMKGALPTHSLAERIKALVKAFPDAEVVIGDKSNNTWNTLKKINPTIVAVGYDQKKLYTALETYFSHNKKRPKLVMLKDYFGDTLHSSLLKKK